MWAVKLRYVDDTGILSAILLLMLCWTGIAATKCQFCHKDFDVVGRHEWRCKARVPSSATSSENPGAQPASSPDGDQANSPHRPTPNSSHRPTTDQVNITYFTCTCGRKCKGRRGLQSHQRCCTAHKSLSSITKDNNSEDPVNEVRSTTNRNDDPADPSNDINNHQNGSNQNRETADAECKPGLKLPKTPSQWKEANLFFHQAFFDFLGTNSIIDDLNECVQLIQNKVYDYFASTYGVIKERSQSQFYNKYCDFSVNAMESSLKKLKAQNGMWRK